MKLRRPENWKLDSFYNTGSSVIPAGKFFPPVSALLATATGDLIHYLIYERENILVVIGAQPLSTRHPL
ncbi:MAG TPA: hypothetical protein VI306_17870 [Pyrinomonadaceae bacterium]